MQPNCPTRQILDRVGDKWAVLILLLLREEPMRFNQLRRTIEGISQKMLSQVLKSLERDGLIKRHAIATVPVTVEYSITQLGVTLAAAVDPLRDWAEQNLKDVLAAQRRYDTQQKDRSGRKTLRLPGLGELDLDAQLDLGQHGIETGIAGGRFQVCRGIAQPDHGRGVEIAGQQSDLEIVEHVERAPAAGDRALAALDRILLDALQREQRVDVGGGLRCGSADASPAPTRCRAARSR